MTIHSKDNAKVKLASQLLRSKKKRIETSLFVCDSKESCSHVLRHYPESVEFILMDDRGCSFLQNFSVSEDKCFLVDADIFSNISTLKQQFGCIVILAQPQPAKQTARLALGLWRINNPSNLGAIIRSAFAFSCEKLYLIGDSCDPFHPESVRASAGHIFDLAFERISEQEFLDLGDDYSIVKMQGHGDESVYDFKPVFPLLILMGSEQGFDDDAQLSHLPSLSIDMKKNCDSLNVAVAASIVLHHCHHFVSRETS